jgi:hypothetical protein
LISSSTADFHSDPYFGSDIASLYVCGILIPRTSNARREISSGCSRISASSTVRFEVILSLSCESIRYVFGIATMACSISPSSGFCVVIAINAFITFACRSSSSSSGLFLFLFLNWYLGLCSSFLVLVPDFIGWILKELELGLLVLCSANGEIDLDG